MSHRSISVIIPTNRGGPYLAEAVASVRAQTSPAAEIVLVDDGSPAPGLADVAAGLGLRYVRREPGGIAAARNTGVDAAEGEWVAFLDDDDVWDPRRLERQQEALDAAPGAIASATGGWYMDETGERFGPTWRQEPATSREMLGGEAPFPRVTTLLARRDVYLGVGGCDASMEPSEDNDLMLRLLQRGEFATAPEPLVGYRRHRANITAARSLRGRAAGLRVIRTHRDAARLAGDADMAALLTANLAAFRRTAAGANGDDLIAAVRARRWTYAAEVAWWGLRHVPREAMGDIGRRIGERGQRRDAGAAR